MKNITITLALLLCGIIAKGQVHNLDFEEWEYPSWSRYDSIHKANSAFGMHIIPNPRLAILKGWNGLGYWVQTTDAYSGNYAAVVHTYYNGTPTYLSMGECGEITKCKMSFPEKLYGLSGFYKHYLDSVELFDTYGKVAMLHIVTYQKDTISDNLVVLTHDSLQFERTGFYKEFYLPISNADGSVLPDSISIWFESKGYAGYAATHYVFANFLYLDNLQLHFKPYTLPPPQNSVDLKHKLKIYPNPATDFIILAQAGDIEVLYVQLTDITGRVVSSYPYNLRMVSVAGLSAGMYILQIKTNEGSLMEKIIIR